MKVIHIPTSRILTVKDGLSDARLKAMDCAIAPKLVNEGEITLTQTKKTKPTKLTEYSKDLHWKKAVKRLTGMSEDEKAEFLKGEKREPVLIHK